MSRKKIAPLSEKERALRLARNLDHHAQHVHGILVSMDLKDAAEMLRDFANATPTEPSK